MSLTSKDRETLYDIVFKMIDDEYNKGTEMKTIYKELSKILHPDKAINTDLYGLTGLPHHKVNQNAKEIVGLMFTYLKDIIEDNVAQ